MCPSASKPVIDKQGHPVLGGLFGQEGSAAASRLLQFVTDDGETGAYRYFDFNLHAQDPSQAATPPEGW